MSNLKKTFNIYSRKGFKLFPISRQTKRPAIKNWREHATDDLSQLKVWAKKFPGCNWGADMAKSGKVAVDVDFSHGGMEAWECLIESNGEPKTSKQRTGSGGLHYVFNAERGQKFKGKIMPGIDIKYNGYIVVYPSINAKGGRY